VAVRNRYCGRELERTRYQSHDLGEVVHAVDADAFHYGSLGGILGGKNQVGDAFGAGADGD